MKIVNTASGKAYQLKPGTQLEIERTNPFLNEWGEQSLPTELPDTDLNRQLTGYPDMIENRSKVSADIDCTIQDGDYFMPARQAILEAQRHEKISTAFYMNEGSFFAKIADVSLQEIFGDETIPGVTSVAEGINFCRSLVNGSHPEFAIFPVLIDTGDTFDNGKPAYKQINRFGTTYEGSFIDSASGLGSTLDFYNAVEREETVDDKTVKITAGFYMSPFIKANYLLKRIFQYFGYTLLDNFFTQTLPFTNMVFINTCADALVNGTIRMVNLIPDCMCNTLLDVFRKRFFCEFIPNEITRTVQIEFFKDIPVQEASCDLSPYLTSHPLISYPESYQQLSLSSEEILSDNEDTESANSLADLVAKYPSVEYNQKYGYFFRRGFWYLNFGWLVGPRCIPVEGKVSASSMRYYAGGDLPEKEISVPDLQPEFRGYSTWSGSYSALHFLFVGEPRYLNSAIIEAGATTPDTTEISDTSSNEELKPMLAFAYTLAGYPRGTITNYGAPESILTALPDIRLWDYSLCFNGPEGLFEKFYRSYDDLLRNSLHNVRVSLLLPSNLKLSIPSHLPVLLGNQRLLINSLNYQIGGENEPLESELLTMKLYEPVNKAPVFSDIVTSQDYEWIAHSENTAITVSEYSSSPYKDLTFDPIYPSQRPSAELAASGKIYYERITCIQEAGFSGGFAYYKHRYWLTCQKKQST
ncbi:hypothetical protein [Bacteroides sp. UBA939]|uniref:hypothetical protein n=1 Tax=Bacteroides sp. UBA939 TaxID=1946092 RepID=UPI0025C1EB97|nr:hypothetical protein [Bacteroides sp. UBA939]